jgi:hypothetical protein
LPTISECIFSNGFSLKEKIYAQTTFLGMIITGTAGIIHADWIFVFPYIFFAWYAIPGIIQRHIVCPRCPHLYEHGDCLQLHPVLTRRFVKKQKGPKISMTEKTIFWIIFILIPVYPIYWLNFNKAYLIIFILLTGLWYGGQALYFCKRCRVTDCPFNRVRHA